jgi:D-glycero-alpha-D-manno-heptose 1-phosphate guanylyltransferase
MQAIVLVGGLGTRLRSVVPDLPKPMAPIQDKPFLAYLLDYLKIQGISKIIFPVHYLAEKIIAYFQAEYAGLSIQYVEEKEALGTGGAIVNALTSLGLNSSFNPGISHPCPSQPLFVLNGDTFVKLDYQAMYAQHIKSGAAITMALRKMQDCHRYGKVVLEGDNRNNRIIEFKEKGEQGEGLINAGVYLIQSDLFRQYNLPPIFSLENDFLFPYLAEINAQAFIADDYFIDIGIPQDYARAVKDFSVGV